MDINDFKKQYENITASEELKMKANREMKKSRFKNGFKISGSVAAALVVAVGVAANTSPAFARAAIIRPFQAVKILSSLWSDVRFNR